MKTPLKICILLIFGLVLGNCETNLPSQNNIETKGKNSELITKNLVMVVIDGPRYQETWGDPLKQHIPFFANELAEQGIHYSNFYNTGATYTTSGHTALTTGNYQWMANDGTEIPINPSIFQLWLQKHQVNPSKTRIITSKEKLQILAKCSDPQWRGRFNPLFDTEDRQDSETLQKALDIFQQDHPQLVLVHFKGPDFYGHSNDWENYLQSIADTDKYTYQIWEHLQSDPFYKGLTTMLVTNDHGRHSDGVRDGFVSHGDLCEGCMHINLFAVGPDFHSNLVINKRRQSVDIAATVAALMDFELPNPSGEVMWELFK